MSEVRMSLEADCGKGLLFVRRMNRPFVCIFSFIRDSTYTSYVAGLRSSTVFLFLCKLYEFESGRPYYSDYCKQ